MKLSVTAEKQPWPNLVAMFFDRVKHNGDKPFLWSKKESKYESLSWNDTANQVCQLAIKLIFR